MKVILKSGHVIKNVICKDSTKSPIGLWVWSMQKLTPQVLTFKGVSILSSEIACIEEENTKEITESDNPYNYMDNSNPNISDDDLPF